MTSSIEQQIQALREQLRDTPAWLRSPSGQPTRLTEQQWLLVRTPGFKRWFGDWEVGVPGRDCSALLDDQGEPLVLFHGSGVDFEEFDFAYTNQGVDQLGSGFYFTNDRKEAESYCFAEREGCSKLGGLSSPTVHEVFLNIRNPLPAEHNGGLTRSQAEALLRGSPDLQDVLTNFGDVDREGEAVALNRAVKAFLGWDDAPQLRLLFMVANDFYPETEHIEAFNRQVRKVLGWDAVVADLPGAAPGTEKRHVVAWFPDQICSATHLERAARRLDAEPRRERAEQECPSP